MRSSPQIGFSAAISRINCRRSLGRRGRPVDGLPTPEQPESSAVPADERIRPHIHQGIAPREHPTQRHHHPAGGVVCPRGLTFRSWKNARCLRRKRFSAARARRERSERTTSRTKSTTTEDIVRMQCATARKINDHGMNAQDGTLQTLPEHDFGSDGILRTTGGRMFTPPSNRGGLPWVRFRQFDAATATHMAD